MEEDYDISSKFKKTKKPSVQVGFFENFYVSIKDEIDAEESFAHLNIAKRKKPTLPENFSIDFSTDLNKKINDKPNNRGRIIRLSFLSAVASIAAVLTILFYINQNDQPIIFSDTEPVIMQNEETIDTYVAYLDEDEMIDYILENDINIGDDEDEIYDYVESEIEDVYLDL